MIIPKEGNKNGIFHDAKFTNRGFFLFKQSPTESEVNAMMWDRGQAE
jgi:hypothetical protein